jgi:hypothetical protein
MSHYMTALAMKQSGLKPAAKIVLYWLADHHNGETGLCFPSLKTLERECEMNRSTIIRHLDDLEAAGLISREKRERENGSQTSTAYYLHLVPVAERNTPCCETQQPPVAKCDPHNLGTINLGNKPLSMGAVSVFETFNEIAQATGWPLVQSQSPAREKLAAQRIKDCGGFDNWRDAMKRAAKSDFLSGRATGSTPATFDWLNKPANFTKLMEGNYDNRTNNPRGNSSANATAQQIAFAATARRTPTEDCF